MSLTFKKIAASAPVIDFTVTKLRSALEADKKVLWLLSGGSAIPLIVAIANQLQNTNVSNLTVSLIDERYGPVGHADSNWQQLKEAGFALPNATLQPVLMGQDIKATADTFQKNLRENLQTCDYRLGFLGIGPDGHTSGILPHSSAVEAQTLVHAYEGGGYQRITTTAKCLAQLDEAVVYAVGESKWPGLDQLSTDVDPADQPAQFLKQIPQVTIFNDYRD